MARKGKKQKNGGCLKGILPVIMLGMVGVFAYYTYIMEDDIAKEHLRFERYFQEYFEQYRGVSKEDIQDEPFRTGKLLVMKTSPDNTGCGLTRCSTICPGR